MTISKNESVRNYLRALPVLSGIFRSQWRSREEMRLLQERKMRNLVRHVYEKVPYYRQLFHSAGIKPEDILSVDDLAKIPITSKQDLRYRDSREVTAEGTDLDRCHVRKTSGSSGVPLQIYWDTYSLTVYYAIALRSHSILGCTLRDKTLCIGPTFYPDNLLVQRLGLCRIKLLSPFAGPEEHIREINAYRPDVLICYPSVYKGICRHLVTSGRAEVHQPRVLISNAEFLDEQTALRIEEGFGARPFNFYGSWEMGRIGHDCLHYGLHINEDVLVPEFVPAGDGFSGYRLVITNLSNYTMPFIRYDQGDLVEPLQGDCACGRSAGRIRILDARESDVIVLPDGRLISVLHLAGIVFGLPGVEQFKMIQERHDRLLVNVVRASGYSRNAEQDAVRRMRSLLPGVEVVFEEVPEIGRDISGKVRQFRSLVQ